MPIPPYIQKTYWERARAREAAQARYYQGQAQRFQQALRRQDQRIAAERSAEFARAAEVAKEARSPEYLMTPPVLYRMYKGTPVQHPSNPSSVDQVTRAFPPWPKVPGWPLAGAGWTPWSTATGTYLFDWAETPQGVALSASDPRRHWSYEAWDAFARYQEEAARFLVEVVAAVKQTLDIIASRTSPAYYITQFQKPTMDLDDPCWYPKTGLTHEYAYENEHSPDGEKLGPGDPRRHFSPVAFAQWESYGMQKAFYNERLAIEKKRMQASYEQTIREGRKFAWGLAITLFVVAAIAITVVVLFVNWANSQDQSSVGVVSHAATFLATGPHLWRG